MKFEAPNLPLLPSDRSQWFDAEGRPTADFYRYMVIQDKILRAIIALLRALYP